LKENIFKSTNMNNTGCDSSSDNIANLAEGYEYKDGNFYSRKDADVSFAFDVFGTFINC
jgi:hypothetical protein